MGRLIGAIWYRGDTPVDGGARALLSSVAVDPDMQGDGLGSSLVKEWLAEMKLTGTQGCYLLTDSKRNDAVNRFYQRLGWKLDSQHRTPRGRVLNRYLFDFNPET
jgi:predicted N-acetyltransferase YhbS